MNRTISVRWLVAAIAGVVVGMFALTGTAAAPPAGAPVRIVDADNAAQVAHVDANGNLQVGGTVGIDSQGNVVRVDSSTPVATTSGDDPGRTAFQRNATFSILPGELFSSGAVPVPAGKRLVITFVSGQIQLPVGQELTQVQLNAGPPGSARHYFAPTMVASVGVDLFAFSQDTLIYSEGFDVTVTRNGLVGTGHVDVAISGYLIDCSVTSCS